MKKRLLSILLMCCMVLTLLPVQALAEDAAYTVGEDTRVSARALAGTAGTKLKADNIATYIANGLGGGVYTLAEDVTISGTLRVKGEATVDLNGHVLRYAETADPDSIFRVAGGKTLTLTDSAPTASHSDASLPAGGLITGGKGFKYDNGAGQSYTYYGGGVYVETGASFVLAGGTIYACGVQSGANAAYGGGIYAEGGSVTMTGGAIRNCVLSANNGANGGGVYIYSGASFTMEGGVISGCSAMSGGGISASGCTVQITGGRIENCKASGRGGGLYIGGHADQISVLDAVISGCEAKRGGGVALINFAELELGENARITGCTATEKDDTEAGAIEYGAAVYTDFDQTYTVNYPGCFLYANGGRVEGTVYVGTNKIGTKNNYLDSVKATNAIDHTDGKPTTVFTGDVSCEGDIRGGIFHGSVTVTDSNGNMGTAWEKFCGNLSGGTFYGPVTTECHVSGGTFYRGLTMNKNAKLSGQPIDTGSELTDKTNIPDPTGTPVTVTYAYGALGGTYATQIVQTGEKAIRPTEPKVNGFTFGGWYTDENCTDGSEYDFETPVTANFTLYAKWEGTFYGIRITDKDGEVYYITSENANDVLGDGTVSYVPGYLEEGKDVDDFTAEDLDKMLRGETVEGIRLPKLTLDGAEFKQLAVGNWGDDSITRQLNLFLQLELMGDNTIAYDETYLAEGAVCSKNVWTLCITGNGTLKVTAPAENGWGLSGDWGLYRQESGTVTIQAGECGIGYDTWSRFRLMFHGGKLTIEAGNDPKDYGVINSWNEISFDISESTTFLLGDSAENCISLTAPYTIDSVRQELTDAYDEGKLTHDPFYLSLTANYTVTFDTDGGSKVNSQTVPYGETAKTPAIPAKTGYTFAGWYLDGKAYDFTAPVTANMTLTAKWTVCDHKGSTAQPTCTTPAICTACGGTLAALGHEWGPWTSGSDNTHTRACKRDGTHTETKNCSGGTATCTAKAVCEFCKAEYGEKLPHDFTAETVDAKYLKSAATCTEKTVYYKSCAVCGLSSEGTADEATFFSGNALDHDWGAWTQNSDEKTHTRICKRDTSHTETKDCSGGRATCKDKARCAVCGKTYGELDAKNHANLKHIDAKAATKTSEGNIEYWHCDGCNKYFSDKGGTKEIKKADTVTEKLKSGSTTAKQEDGSKSPGTGDTSNLALWSALLFVSGGAAIGTTVVSRRKKYNR